MVTFMCDNGTISKCFWLHQCKDDSKHCFAKEIKYSKYLRWEQIQLVGYLKYSSVFRILSFSCNIILFLFCNQNHLSFKTKWPEAAKLCLFNVLVIKIETIIILLFCWYNTCVTIWEDVRTAEKIRAGFNRSFRHKSLIFDMIIDIPFLNMFNKILFSVYKSFHIVKMGLLLMSG